MIEELRNAAVLVRRGSWFDPGLFEKAADEIEQLQQDAKRYRFIRDDLEVCDLIKADGGSFCVEEPSELDEAIDAAMEGK